LSSTSCWTSSIWWMLLSSISTLWGPGYGLVRGICTNLNG
jgi:hypothetical protein